MEEKIVNINNYVLNALQKKHLIDDDADIMTLNYVEEGYVDSLGIIKFVVDLEEEFGIEFTDDELCNPSFRIVGELIKLVEKKAQK